MRDGQDEARALLAEGLQLSLATHSTPLVSLCLVGFARSAWTRGDAERAALLAGAAEGLRRRLGVRAWPVLRRGEDDLEAELRRALGADRFDEVFAAGSRLNRQETLAAIRDGRGAEPRRPD